MTKAETLNERLQFKIFIDKNKLIIFLPTFIIYYALVLDSVV